MENYSQLGENSSLEINVSGSRLDVYSLGVLHLNLQDIFDKVAFRMLSEAGLVEPTWKRPGYLPPRHHQTPRRYIRAEVNSAKIGSWETEIIFSIVKVLADPNVIAILQNLAANVIWAVGASGVRGISRRTPKLPDTFVWRQKNDPIEIGNNLRDVMVALAENNQGRECVLTFKHNRNNQETFEVSIFINGDRQ